MARKNILDWFLTERGKQASLLFAGGATSLTLCGHIVPNTVFVSQYKDIIRLYSKGFSVPVPEKIQRRFSKTLDLLEIQDPDRFDLRPFMAAGFDIFSIGTFGRFGTHIAIPVNFTYDKIDDIDKSRIKINLESVIWESDAAKQLLDALVLSEKAQMYSMAREIRMRRSYKFFFDTFYATLACFTTYAFSKYLNIAFNLFSKPRPVRVTGYILAALLNLGNYCMAKDATQNYYEKKIDQDLKARNPVFAEGGKEFYTKILERNKALRELMGEAGKRTYSVLGNEMYYIRNKHMPLVHRKQLFEDKDLSTGKPVGENIEVIQS